MYNFTSFLKSLNSEQFYIKKKLNSKIKAAAKAIKSNIICKYLQWFASRCICLLVCYGVASVWTRIDWTWATHSAWTSL